MLFLRKKLAAIGKTFIMLKPNKVSVTTVIIERKITSIHYIRRTLNESFKQKK